MFKTIDFNGYRENEALDLFGQFVEDLYNNEKISPLDISELVLEMIEFSILLYESNDVLRQFSDTKKNKEFKNLLQELTALCRESVATNV